MERGKRIRVIHGETHLHEAIIQQIQSFLNYKEAAQTSILSKSWFNAWATRPVVDLDQRNFQNPGGADSQPLISDGFSKSSKKIVRRYEESNLKIENFRLCMRKTGTDSFSLANELIVRAMGLGARDLTFEFLSQTVGFVLPYEEVRRFLVSGRRIVEFVLPNLVLGSRNLVRLSVSGCRIDLQATHGKVGFWKLKFLSLRRACIVGYSIWDIISSCPLIEELVLSDCTSMTEVQPYNGGTLEIRRTLALTEFGNQNVGSTVVDQITQYGNLKCMFLKKIEIDNLLFHDTSRSFPCLKDLTLDECHGFIELQISSPSLEFLNISHKTVFTAKFHVPSLGRFAYSGVFLPSLSFESASREWESFISVENPHDHISSAWFVRLKDLLMRLSLSKISLSLSFGMFCFDMLFEDGFEDIGDGDGRGLPKPVVENLLLAVYLPTEDCSLLLKGVFWSCRPKFVTDNWLPECSVGNEGDRDMVSLLCETLIEEEIENCCMARRYKYDDLEEVNVEGFDDSIAEWQPLQWKEALLDASKAPEKKQKLRFKFRWGLHPSALDETLRK